mmetsp:Transcript_23747/g.52099  ORF Transcript_23747/g.52099 Transcript_23747/m.52099 type:complete len:280 (+) Transcript_23747:50-889(+)|eukprot:CAMPEP_0202919986 /NCGR_PEP_ID=MMETSP1392-20130828/76622_1 /ASSEMBLY_ACC=CAM_ASM_000868 /TAXON_ID=225041 /ORGANISM="Chlamydomonas chlamydogama, Strain SAG 11-48b" /LENGTH=279 /DNA_ID=CAMNT_0049613461 /DNA_START=50 /DNA_END=889 /DNA_ORIENTATION=+
MQLHQSFRLKASRGAGRSGCGKSPRVVVCCSAPGLHEGTAAAAPAAGADRRRTLLLLGSGALLAGGAAGSAVAEEAVPAAAPAPPAAASRAAGGLFRDPVDKFSLQVPPGWAFGEGRISGGSGYSGATGARRTLAWFPDDPSIKDVNLTVVITNVSVEFTKLGSFGNVDTFAGNLVNSLDRSYLLRKPAWGPPNKDPVQVARLVAAKDTGGCYNVEYTVQMVPGGVQRHLLSALTLGSNGLYNRLYTVTGQCPEADLAKYRPVLEAMIKSFEVSEAPRA